MKKSKNNLWRTKTYLVGHMQYKSGRDWRGYVTEELNPLGITVFDPYHKPFVEDVDEDEEVVSGVVFVILIFGGVIIIFCRLS